MIAKMRLVVKTKTVKVQRRKKQTPLPHQIKMKKQMRMGIQSQRVYRIMKKHQQTKTTKKVTLLVAIMNLTKQLQPMMTAQKVTLLMAT